MPKIDFQGWFSTGWIHWLLIGHVGKPWNSNCTESEMAILM